MNLLRLFKRELSSEARRWVNEGIVERGQAKRILALYGAEYDREPRSFAYQVLLSLGALFMGLSLLVLVSANWDEIPRALRMGSMLLLTLGLQVSGLWHWKMERSATARLFFFMGSISYGASIFLIAQIYHLGEHYPDGIYWWALGTMPFALLTRGLLLHILILALGSLWMITESTEGFLPLSYPLFLLASFRFCLWDKKSTMIFLAAVVGSCTWVELLLGSLLGARFPLVDFAPMHLPFTFGIFVLLHALGRAMEFGSLRDTLQEYGMVLRLWSIRFGLICLLIFSYSEAWKEFLRIDYDHPEVLTTWLVSVSLAVQFFVLMRSGSSGLTAIRSHASSLLFLFLWLAATILSMSHVEQYALHLQVFVNLLLVFTGIHLITRGLRNAMTHYFYTGIGLLLTVAFLRYIDLVGDYIGASLLFFVSGGILFGAARFWNHQQKKAGKTGGES